MSVIFGTVQVADRIELCSPLREMPHGRPKYRQAAIRAPASLYRKSVPT